ncbi:MAG: aminopeptidase [Solirubrobacteraceae bacterium]
MDELRGRCAKLDALGIDEFRFTGPGTDLTIGLPPDHRWLTAALTSRRGVGHVINLPTEEVATSPDPGRAEVRIRSTRPLALGGTIVRDLEMRLAGGRIPRGARPEHLDHAHRLHGRRPGRHGQRTRPRRP